MLYTSFMAQDTNLIRYSSSRETSHGGHANKEGCLNLYDILALSSLPSERDDFKAQVAKKET